MITPGSSLPSFNRGDLLKAADLQTLVSALRQLMPLDGSLHSTPPELVVILDADLAARDGLKSKSVLATVCRWKLTAGSTEEGEFVQTKRQQRVFAIAGEDKEKDTLGVARWIEGAYRFIGDCEPLDDREDPPWMETT